MREQSIGDARPLDVRRWPEKSWPRSCADESAAKSAFFLLPVCIKCCGWTPIRCFRLARACRSGDAIPSPRFTSRVTRTQPPASFIYNSIAPHSFGGDRVEQSGRPWPFAKARRRLFGITRPSNLQIAPRPAPPAHHHPELIAADPNDRVPCMPFGVGMAGPVSAGVGQVHGADQYCRLWPPPLRRAGSDAIGPRGCIYEKGLQLRMACRPIFVEGF